MKISVILPVYNEEKGIAACLRNLRDHHRPDEIIIADGGSSDQTLNAAEGFGRVIRSGKGRAAQMNAGAAAARGDIFLFLHADTMLPEGGLESIRSVIRNGAQAGRFRLRFNSSKWLLRLYASYTRFHIFSYGDQGFFVTKELFEKIGGFAEDVPFEDIDFYKKLRKHTKPVILNLKVITSARRFLEVGCLKQKWVNLMLIALYYAGWDVLSLKKKAYADVR